MRFDRDQSVLLAQLVGENGMVPLTRLYERLADPELVPAVTALSERFARIGPDSTEQDVRDLIECAVAALTPVVADLAGADPPLDLGASADLLGEYAAGMLNERQRAVLEHLAARLDPSGATGVADRSAP